MDMSDVLYVIMSCHKTLATRRILQTTSFLRDLPAGSSYIYLCGGALNTDTDVFNCGVEDDYLNTPYKYIEFFRNFSLFSNFEWIALIDDDTFIFPKRLKKLLKNIPANTLIGKSGFIFHEDQLNDPLGPSLYNGIGSFPCDTFSGGAGFVIPSNVGTLIQKYLLNKTNNEIPFVKYGDVSMALWLKELNTNLQFKHIPLFSSQPPLSIENIDYDINHMISFHYCKHFHFRYLSYYL